MRILVVGYDTNAQASVTQALSQTLERPEFLIAAKEVELRESIACDDVALVVMNHPLPWSDDLHGLHLLHRLRPELPVVMVTVDGSEELVADAFKAGVSDYLPMRRLDRLGEVACQVIGPSNRAAPSLPDPSYCEVDVSALIDTARSILRKPTFEKTAEAVLEACKQVIGAPAGYIGLLTSSRESIDIICLDEDPYACALDADLQMRVCGTRELAYRQRKAVYINGASRADWGDAAPEYPALETVLCVPMIFEEDVLGFLELADKPGGFTETDALIATLFAELAMVSLQHTRIGDTLYRREAQFRRFAQASPDGIILTDSEGHIVEWNEAEESITGIPAAEAIGVPLWDRRIFLAPEANRDESHYDYAKQQMLDCLATGELVPELAQGEHAIVRPDGSERLIRYRLFPIPVGEGFGLGSITWDITEQAAARDERDALLEETRRQRRFLERLIQSLPIGVAVVSGHDHRYQLVNPAYEQIPRMDDTPLVGHRFTKYLPPDTARVGLDLLEEAYRTGQTVRRRRFEVELVTGEASTLWDIVCVPLTNDGDESKSALVIAHNVTDEVHARREIEHLAEALQQERDILKTTMENTQTHLAYLDADFRFVNVNAAYAESSDYTKEELIGRNHFDLFPDPENQTIFEEVRDTGVTAVFQARPFVFPGQPERGVTYWDWSLAPILGSHGRTMGLVLSLNDVTERERAIKEREHHLERMQELVDIAEQLLAERTLGSLLECVVDAARRLTKARLGYGFHGHEPQTYLVVTADSHGIASRQRPAPLSIQAAWQEIASVQTDALSLDDEAVRRYLVHWGLPRIPGHHQQLMGARLVGHHGETCAILIVSGADKEIFEPGAASILAQLAALASSRLQNIEAYEETQRRVAELDTTISSIADAVVIYGPSGHIVRMNEAGKRLLMTYAGVKSPLSESQDKPAQVRKELPDQSSGDMFSADSFPVGRALGGQTMPGYVTKLEHPETDDAIWVSVSAAPIWGADDQLDGAVAVFRDITALRAFQNQLETANEKLEQQAKQLQSKTDELVDRNQELRLLNNVGRDLSATLELKEVLDRVLEAARQVVSVDSLAIWLVDREHSEWLVRHTSATRDASPDRSKPERVRVWGKQGILGRVSRGDGDAAKPALHYKAPGYWAIKDHPSSERLDVVVPLRTRDRLIGVIEVMDGEEILRQPDATFLLTTMATWAAIAIENALLHREAKRAAVVTERHRLAGELHDAVSQLLFSAKVTAEALTRLWETNPEAVRNGLDQLQALTEGALAEMRTLLLELRPTALIETDIDELLRQLTLAVSGRSKLSISLELAWSGRLPGDVQITLYRITQEALNNTIKHARADRAGVVLRRCEAPAAADECVTLLIWDDGRGFDPTHISADAFGLQIIRERAAAIGAVLDINSEIGEGTRISVRWSRQASGGVIDG